MWSLIVDSFKNTSQIFIILLFLHFMGLFVLNWSKVDLQYCINFCLIAIQFYIHIHSFLLEFITGDWVYFLQYTAGPCCLSILHTLVSTCKPQIPIPSILHCIFFWQLLVCSPPTRWTWVWVNSRRWWWTGRPGELRFIGWQRVGHDWATELNWVYSPCLWVCFCFVDKFICDIV